MAKTFSNMPVHLICMLQHFQCVISIQKIQINFECVEFIWTMDNFYSIQFKLLNWIHLANAEKSMFRHLSFILLANRCQLTLSAFVRYSVGTSKFEGKRLNRTVFVSALVCAAIKLTHLQIEFCVFSKYKKYFKTCNAVLYFFLCLLCEQINISTKFSIFVIRSIHCSYSFRNQRSLVFGIDIFIMSTYHFNLFFHFLSVSRDDFRHRWQCLVIFMM